MRKIYTRHSTILAAVFLMTLMACSKPMTKQKVTDNIKEAREAAVEAKEAIRVAIESREQLYADYRKSKVEELEGKIDRVEEQVKDLRRTSKTSENAGAKSDIESAISNLEKEKRNVERQIDEVKAIRKLDWTSSYQALDQAILQLEQEIQRLSDSLEDYE